MDYHFLRVKLIGHIVGQLAISAIWFVAMTFGGFHKKKRRSKQKNLKKDTRPENLRPGGADYVPLTERPGYVPPPVEADETTAISKQTPLFEDKPLNCRDCSEEFMFTSYEQKNYKKKGFDSVPTRCKRCRESKRDKEDSNKKDEETKHQKLNKRNDLEKPPQGENIPKKKSKIVKSKNDGMLSDPVGVDEKKAKEESDEQEGSDTSDDSDNDESESEVNKLDEKESDDDDDDKDDDEEDEDDGWDDWTEGSSKWDERDESICAEPLKSFDLYEALELTPDFILSEGQVKGGSSRLRAQYHRLSMRYHPETFTPMRSGNATSVPTQRKAAELRFRRVAVAFETLKDPARAAIYATHGFDGLEKSEQYAEQSVLDTRPFARFDGFFEATDPDDREYLLLEAASGGNFSDDENDNRGEVTEPEDNDDDDEEEEDDEDEDEMLQAVMLECKQKKEKQRDVKDTKKTDDRLPFPPSGSSGGAYLNMLQQPSQSNIDPFARIASQVKRKQNENETKQDVINEHEKEVKNTQSKKKKKKRNLDGI